ncbi:hypothetical protein Tco_0032999 [Tanacetum coccineum]
MLSIGGRLMLIKSVLGSMPIFHMSMFKVPAGVIQILESLRSKFFNGHESSGKKASWVQWKKALAPKDNGGLDVRSLRNRVLPCFWFGKKKLGNGLSTLFWDDVWCDGGKLKNRFPRAYALENSKQITVGQKLAHPSLYHSFRRHPRGGLELTQVEELAKVINPVVLTQSRILVGGGTWPFMVLTLTWRMESWIDNVKTERRRIKACSKIHRERTNTCYKQETNIVLWYERISSFDISKVGRDGGNLLEKYDVQNLLTLGTHSNITWSGSEVDTVQFYDVISIKKGQSDDEAAKKRITTLGLLCNKNLNVHKVYGMDVKIDHDCYRVTIEKHDDMLTDRLADMFSLGHIIFFILAGIKYNKGDLTKPKPSNDNLKPIYGDLEALDLLKKLLHEVQPFEVRM